MWTCLIDVRCLQDPSYRDRGIGRHALALLRHARALLPEARLIGIEDATLSPLGADVRSLLDEVRSHAYTGTLTGPCVFVSLSPMTHDPLFVARQLHHPAIPAAAVVYDFIPLDAPDRYLTTSGGRLDYHVALRWLARYDLLLPISQDAAARARGLLTLRDDQVAVTGAPLAPAFDAVTPGPPAHVLVVGGADPRKNPECAIRAHAASRVMQAGRILLLVTGRYGADWLATQRAAIAAAGGDPALLEMPGHVDEDALLALYRGAWCVVAPSRAEGFSLPVIEAMAAHVPVLASDIPAHRELLCERLFPPDDAGSLTILLDQVTDPAWRQAAVERQKATWPRFRELDVARRAWTAVANLVPRARGPAIIHGRARVALLTPLPPDRSGVADFSVPMCLALGDRVELHVFTPTVDPVHPPGAASVGPLSALPFLSSDYDRVIGVLGNSVYHLDILRLLLRYGGAAILHDGRMLDLYAGHMTLERTRAMAQAELGRLVHRDEMQSWLDGTATPLAMILADVVAAADPLMLHSHAAIRDIEHRYGAGAIHLPFPLYRAITAAELTTERRAQARHRLGVSADEVIVVTFGYVHPAKAPIDCIWATELLRSWGIPARLRFVGAPLMATEPLVALIDELDLAPYVHLSDAFVDEQTYRDHLLGADIAIQLRPGATGSVSGALADCIAAGLRAVASETLVKALDAPDYVTAIPDNPSPVLIAEAVAALLARPVMEEVRAAYAASHGFDTYTDRLCEALAIP